MERYKSSFVPITLSIEAYRIMDTKMKTASGDEDLSKSMRKRLNSFENNIKAAKTKVRYTEDGVRYIPLTYHNFPNFLKLTGLTISEFFKASRLNLKWPTEDGERVCSKVKRLNGDQTAKILRLSETLSPSFWKVESRLLQDNLINPIKKILYLNTKYKLQWSDDRGDTIEKIGNKALTEEYIAWRGKTNMSLDFADIMKASEVFEVSPVWLLGWADKENFALADSKEGEYIMAAYYFMSPSARRIFETVLDREIAGKGESEEGGASDERDI